MSLRHRFSPRVRLLAWRLRYWWLDTPAGRAACHLGALLFALLAAWRGWALTQLPADAPQLAVVNFWVQLAIMVVASLVMMALAPKPKDTPAAEGEVPVTEDGAAYPIVFGEEWIDAPVLIGWKKLGTANIRGKKSGFSGRPIIGYWYKYAQLFLLARGPIDALLEVRGGDKTAWSGAITSNTQVAIKKRDLWGGDKTGGEGGIDGELTVLMGAPDQLPSAAVTEHFPGETAYRGKALALVTGIWGAFSPYPKRPAFKVRRILQGWAGGEAWYPERARIMLTPPGSLALYFALDLSGSMNTVASNGKTRLENMKAAVGAALEDVRSLSADGAVVHVMVVGFGSAPSGRSSISRTAASPGDIDAVNAWVQGRTTAYGTYFAAGVMDMPTWFFGKDVARKLAFFVTDGLPDSPGMAPEAIAEEAGEIVRAQTGVQCYGINIDLVETRYTAEVHTAPGGVTVVESGNPAALTAVIRGAIYGGVSGMNPAHMLYQSITDPMLGAEPVANINDASFRTAADQLYAEGLGLCTQWMPSTESVESFQQRICNLAGASLSRSPIDGTWHLDLVRGGYSLAGLPVLTDDDIIEYSEQPTTVDDAVNQVVVEWFDRDRKEQRSTAPVRSLGAIQNAGAVVSETMSYPEVPSEALALRLAARDLQAKAPGRRLSPVVTRVAWAWRPAQVVLLQAPKRGIASMAIRLADVDRGTLRSGAIKLEAVQDVFSMPATVYVPPSEELPEPTGDLAVPALAAVALERSYAELASALSVAELAALGSADAYLMAVATPAGAEMGYALYTDAGGGYQSQDEGGWSPTALAAAAGPWESEIAVTNARGLEDVPAGALVVWDSELCRLDHFDPATGTVTLARGCVDTVPAVHPAGRRLFVIDDNASVDPQVYSADATVGAKVVTYTGSDALSLSEAGAHLMTFRGRAARPYPPADVRFNGQRSPESITGDVTITLAHRNRVAQGQQLVPWDAPSVAPEAGTTYVARAYGQGTSELLYTSAPWEGDSYSFQMPINADVRVEVVSVRAGLECLQPATAEFVYRTETPELEGAAPDATIGQPYSFAYTVSGGFGPYSWAVIGGALPLGLALDPDTGELAGDGLDLLAGSYAWLVEVTDALGASAQLEDAITVAPGYQSLSLTSSSSDWAFSDEGRQATVVNVSPSWLKVRAAAAKAAGKWYFEVTIVNRSGDVAIGIAPAGTSTSTGTGGSLNAGDGGRMQYFGSGQKRRNGTYAAYGASISQGDVIGIAYDATGRTVTAYKNGVSQGVMYSGSEVPTSAHEPHLATYGSGVVGTTFRLNDALQFLPAGYEPWKA